MTFTPEEVRAYLVDNADIATAADIANQLGDIVNDHINAMHVSMATSLMARALLTRAIRITAAEWWADVTKLPTPTTFAALESVEHDPPPSLNTHTWKDTTR